MTKKRHQNHARSAARKPRALRPVEPLESRILLAVFTVTNTNDSGAGSLRDALNQSNNTVGVDTIAFNITAASKVIRPASALPDLWDPGILDATTQPGYAGSPLVQLDGTNAGANITGMKMWGGSTIKGLAITGFTGSAIDMFNRGFGGNTAKANWIGLDLTGAAAGNNGQGVGIWGTSNNVIGGPNAADRNVISSSKNALGVLIQGSAATNNTIQGNYIGTDPTGNAARPNATNGIGVQDSPSNSILNNLVSGNTNDGIIILNANAKTNIVQGNIVGLNAAGTTALPNQWYGIEIQSANNTIGGTTAAQRNVFSGNGQTGIVLFQSGATGNVIQGNYIGTDITGNLDRGNVFQGIAISGSSGNSIKGNLISGNNAEGVGVFPGNNNTIQGNTIGFGANGTVISNSTWAITLINGSTGNLVGGTAAGEANIIYSGHPSGTIFNGGGNTVSTNTIVATQSTSIPGAFAFSSATYSAAENGTTATITVTRTAGTNVAANVNYATSNGTATAGSDYTATSGTLSFAAGDTSKTFTVTITNDTAVEGNETVNLTLSSPTAGATLGTQSTAVLTITDDDVAIPGSFAFSAATYSVAENGTTATITVTRTAGTNVAATVNYATSNGTAASGSDYTASSGTLSFAAGDTSKTFTVAITNDTAVEGSETVNLTLSSPTAGATLGTQSTAVLTITDDDVAVPGSFAFSAATYSAAENATTATITVTRTAGTNVAATVNYATTNGTATAGSDYTASSGTLSFAAGDTSKTFTVSLTNDTAVEGNETVNLTLSSPTAGATLGTQSTAVLTITDDDVAVPGAFAFSAATYSAAENAGTTTITVTRTAGTNVAASVNYATTNGSATSGSDYTAATGTLNFAAGDTSKTFTITLLNDTALEGNETVNLTLSSPTAGATLAAQSTATLTITDDEVAIPGVFTFNASTYSVNEPQGTITITVNRTAGANVAAAVNYATANGTAIAGSDYTAASGTLNFAAGDTSKTFTIAITNDTAVESNETVSLALSVPTAGATLGTPSTATLTIVSDDVPDTTPPTVTSVNFQYNSAQHKLVYTFSENVSATLSSADLYINDTTTYQSYSPTGYSYDTATNTATFTFPGALPKGVYRSTLFSFDLSDAAGNQLDGDNNGTAGGSNTYDFFFLPADSNHDGKVDFTDMVALSQHYDLTGQTIATGDFNYDGKVDFADLTLLAQNYDTFVNVPQGSPALAASQPAAATVTATPTTNTVALVPVVTTTAPISKAKPTPAKHPKPELPAKPKPKPAPFSAKRIA